jgi:toxin secretion/phage lysis holin
LKGNVEHVNNLPIVFTGGMTGLTALFGGWDEAMEVFIWCVILDIVTGVIKGFVLKEFSSRRMRKGFATKFGYFVVIALATQFDKLMPEDAPILRTIAVWFYIFVEGSSVLENLAQMGVPIPQQIVDRLAVFKDKGGEQATLKDGKFEEKN